MTAKKRLAIAKKELLQIKKLMDKHKFNIDKWGDASYYIVYTKYTEYEINATTTIFPVIGMDKVIYVRKGLRNKNKLTFWDTDKGEFIADGNYEYCNITESKYFKTPIMSIWPINTSNDLSHEVEERYNYSWEYKNNSTMIELKSDIYRFVKNISKEINKLSYVKNTITEMKSECTGMTDYLIIRFINNNTIVIRISELEPICDIHDYTVNIVDKTFYDILNEVLDIVMQNNS